MELPGDIQGHRLDARNRSLNPHSPKSSNHTGRRGRHPSKSTLHHLKGHRLDVRNQPARGHRGRCSSKMTLLDLTPKNQFLDELTFITESFSYPQAANASINR